MTTKVTVEAGKVPVRVNVSTGMSGDEIKHEAHDIKPGKKQTFEVTDDSRLLIDELHEVEQDKPIHDEVG